MRPPRSASMFDASRAVPMTTTRNRAIVPTTGSHTVSVTRGDSMLECSGAATVSGEEWLQIPKNPYQYSNLETTRNV